MLPLDPDTFLPPETEPDQPCRVLLVDDDLELLEMVGRRLQAEPENFEVVTASNGDQAFMSMVDFTPDVVVLDVNLPDMNGIEIMNQIHDIHPRAHIVVLTGHVNAEQREVALRAGAVRFLEKPVELDGFKRLLLELGLKEREGSGLEGGMDIMDLVQMMYVCQKSTSIRFVSKRHRGTLRFERGEAVHIHDGDTSGPSAFLTMALQWGEGRFYTLSEESAGALEQNNWTPTASLLMDAAELRENPAGAPLPGGPPAVIFDMEPPTPVTEPLPPEPSPDPVATEALPATGIPTTGIPTTGIPATGIPATGTPATGTPAASAPEAGVVPPDAPTLRLDLPILQDLLGSLVALEGVRMAAIVDWDGFLLEGRSRTGKAEMDILGAVIATGIGSTQVIGRGFQVGATSLAMLEFEKGTVLVSVIGDQGILAVLLDPTANLGLTRYQIKKLAPAIEEAMRG